MYEWLTEVPLTVLNEAVVIVLCAYAREVNASYVCVYAPYVYVVNAIKYVSALNCAMSVSDATPSIL